MKIVKMVMEFTEAHKSLLDPAKFNALPTVSEQFDYLNRAQVSAHGNGYFKTYIEVYSEDEGNMGRIKWSMERGERSFLGLLENLALPQYLPITY